MRARTDYLRRARQDAGERRRDAVAGAPWRRGPRIVNTRSFTLAPTLIGDAAVDRRRRAWSGVEADQPSTAAARRRSSGSRRCGRPARSGRPRRSPHLQEAASSSKSTRTSPRRCRSFCKRTAAGPARRLRGVLPGPCRAAAGPQRRRAAHVPAARRQDAGRLSARRRRAAQGEVRRGAWRSGAPRCEVYERLSKTKTTAPDDVLMRVRPRGEGGRSTPTKRSRRLARRLRISVQRSGADSPAASSRACRSRRLLPGTHRYKLELGRGERLFGAKRYTQARPVFEALRPVGGGRRPRAGAAAARRMRLLPEAHAQRARRREAVTSTKASRQGEALYLLRRRDARSRRPRRIPSRRPPDRRRVPDPELGRRSAEQPRDASTSCRTTTIRRTQTFREMYREVPDRPLRRARGVEDRLVGVQERAAMPTTVARVRIAPRRTSRAPTTVRRGCTGRRARTRRCGNRRSPTRATRWSPPTT